MKYRGILNESLNSKSLTARSRCSCIVIKIAQQFQNNVIRLFRAIFPHKYITTFRGAANLFDYRVRRWEHNFTSIFPVPFEFRARSGVSAGSEIKADLCVLFLNVVLSVSKARDGMFLIRFDTRCATRQVKTREQVCRPWSSVLAIHRRMRDR